MIYNCRKVILNPLKGLITYNYDPNKEKDEVVVDSCLADEIEQLWANGIVTTGCCCGHGKGLGFINVRSDCIDKMIELGYQNYIFNDEFGGVERKDTFIPKSTHHIYDGYSDGYLG